MEDLVVHCDVLDLFSVLTDGSVGSIITDPPEQLPSVRHVVREAGRVMRPGGGLVVIGQTAQTLRPWERLVPYAGFSLMAELVVLWDSGRPRTRNFGSLHSRVLWWVKNGHRYTFNIDLDPNQQIFSNVLVAKRVPVPYRVHPSEKPVGLTNFLVSLLTNSDDLIVDPFCGSGSTLVSAVQCGRRYLGCDVDAQAVEVATRRVRCADMESPEPLFLWANGVQHEV